LRRQRPGLLRHRHQRCHPALGRFYGLVNQQAALAGSPPAGFINPAVYAIGEGQNPAYPYAACFHDIITGNNYWSGSPSNYPAVAGYDLCTGWGTPAGQPLINALAGQYTINASAGSGGSIAPSGSFAVSAAANLAFTAAPSANYVVNQWLLDGSVAQTGGTNFTLSNVQAGHTVQVSFTYAPVQYTITASAGSGGTIAPNGSFTVSAGTNLTFTATPNPSYAVNQWLLDGSVAQTGGTNYTLANVQVGHTVQVSFTYAPVQYTINASAGSGGSVVPNGSFTVNAGINLTFSATPSSSYGVNQWLLDGSVVQTGGTSYTLANVQAAHTVQVSFTLQYPITATAGSGGSVAPSGSFAVNVGTNLTFTATPNLGYVVNQWLVDGSLAQTGGASYTLNNVQAGHSMQVSFTYAQAPGSTYTWGGTNSLWTDTSLAAWNGGPPGTNDAAYITNAAACTVTNTASNQWQNVYLHLGRNATLDSGNYFQNQVAWLDFVSGGTLRLSQASAYQRYGTFIFPNNFTLCLTGSGTLTWNGVINPTASVTLSLQGSGAGVMASTLNNNGSSVLSITKAGTGTWALTGANTYTGATAINGGILNAGIAQNGTTSGPLGASGNIVFGSGILQFSSASSAWDPSSRIAAGTSSGAVAIDTAGQSITFANALSASQSGGLKKLGTGTLTLSQTEAYTGATLSATAPSMSAAPLPPAARSPWTARRVALLAAPAPSTAR
jgi:autotransporter-associated beta strand protein